MKILPILAVALVLAATGSAEERPLPTRQLFQLDAETGCYEYTGTAEEFEGFFKGGTYVGVVMNTLDASGKPVPSASETRIPIMDAPSIGTEPGFWFGPLPVGGFYVISFMPQAAFGHPGRVVICARPKYPLNS